MDYVNSTLVPGVNLTYVRQEKYKTEQLGVSFILPLNSINAAGLTLLSRVISRGTSRHATLKSLTRALEENYGCDIAVYPNKIGESLCFTFSLSSLKNRYAIRGEDIFGASLKLLSDLIFSPRLVGGFFDGNYVNREKQTLTEQIISLINNKPAYAKKRAVEIMCYGEPYAIPSYGDIETLGKFNKKSLTELYYSLINTAPVEITYAGEEALTEQRLSNCFFFKERDYILPGVSPCGGVKKVREVTEKTHAAQSTLVLCFRVGGSPAHGDYTAFTLFCELFAHSPTSRLFVNVREKLSLCYYATLSFDRLKGVMTVTTGIDAKNRKRAKAAIMRELNSLQNGDFTREEFQNALSSSLSTYKEALDDPSLASSYRMARIIQGSFVPLEEEMERLCELTAEDVAGAASNITLDTVYLLLGEE